MVDDRFNTGRAGCGTVGSEAVGAKGKGDQVRAIALKLRSLKDLEQVVVIPRSYKAFGLHTAFEGLVFLE